MVCLTTRCLTNPASHTPRCLTLVLVILTVMLSATAGTVSADEDPPELLRVLGSFGAAEAPFLGPYDVAVDSDGYIYVADTHNHRVQMFNGTDWTTIGGDGEVGTAPGEFNQPRGVTVGPDGTVYVAERENHRVQMFDGEAWTVIGGDGEIGAECGEFHFPAGLALDTAGTLYVTDGGNHRIQAWDGLSWSVFAGTTGVTGTDPGEFSFPLGIAIDPNSGDMYVTDYDNNRVQHFDGSVWSVIGGGAGTDPGQFAGPVKVAVSPGGDLYASDLNNHRIQLFDGASWSVFAGTTGVKSVTAGQFARPTGVAVDTEGNVYVAELDNCRVQMFDSSGTFLTMWAPGPQPGKFNQPWGVSVGADGSVYVADRNNHRIQRFSGGTWSVMGGNGLSGKIVGVFFNMPTGVAVDTTTDDVYAADTGNHRIQKYDGTSWTLVGGNAEGTAGTDPGEFNVPRGIAVHTDGTVYVADVGNHRIQMFDGVDWTVIGGDGTAGSDPGEFNSPARVCVDSGGNVHAADTGNHRIQVFDGVEWTVFAGTGSASSAQGEFDSPTGVVIDSQGNVYVAERGNNRVQKFDSTGTFLATWGSGGSEPGYFAAANDVALGPNGDIYVADTCPFESCNHRIQVFTYRDVAHLALERGWNLVSVPFTIGDNTVRVIFGGSDIAAICAWSAMDGEYEQLDETDVIDPCRAYWVAANTEQQLPLDGPPLTVEEWQCDLAAGWNMVGAPWSSEPIPLGDLNDGDAGALQVNAVYYWDAADGRYVSATGLVSGRGYWMAATDTCTLSIAPGTTETAIHTQAWTDAAEQCADSDYYKYSLYSTRTLAVANPEVYLQADTLWMDMISTYGGWQANYLQRDRQTPEAGWDEEIRIPINEGFRNETGEGAFEWESVEWANHSAAVVDLFDLYDGAFTFDWLDNRLLFIWSALKGESWAMPQSSLAELLYLDMLRQDMSPYLLFQEDRDALVATVIDTTVTLYDPVTGGAIAEPSSDVVLVMNNDYVWYPLMGRDDTGDDTGLALVVDEYCAAGALPSLSSAEDSLMGDLSAGTALETQEDFAWATLFAARAVNQYTWWARPLRELSADVFPDRYAEDSDYSDTPYEQQAIGMVVTEMGNRLSPLSSRWAAGVRACATDMDTAFAYLGDTYHGLFHRTDEYDDLVSGDYYHCWQPNMEDKLISRLGNCIVEACNTMSALYLADVPDWDILLTNWWSLGETGGHVICGAYSDSEARTLSNGLFRTNDGACLHGPLWSINGAVAEEVIYSPSTGFLAFVQTVGAASFSAYLSPFTSLPYGDGYGFLEDLEGLEPALLIAHEYGGEAGISISNYIDSLPDMEADWPDNVHGWDWP